MNEVVKKKKIEFFKIVMDREYRAFDIIENTIYYFVLTTLRI